MYPEHKPHHTFKFPKIFIFCVTFTQASKTTRIQNMRSALILVVVLSIGFVSGTACKPQQDAAKANNAPSASPSETVSPSAASDASAGQVPQTSAGQPKTIRDFFMLLPEKYFVLEGCVREKDKDCRKARLDYLKTFTEVEDTANGYFKGGCDGAQSCIEMTIFKKPDGSYLVAVSTESEMVIEQHFLDYADGKWTDAAGRVIPEFSKKNIYQLPRQGTTMSVFEKKVTEKGDDYEIAEKGTKLYDLVWKDGKFSIKK